MNPRQDCVCTFRNGDLSINLIPFPVDKAKLYISYLDFEETKKNTDAVDSFFQGPQPAASWSKIILFLITQAIKSNWINSAQDDDAEFGIQVGLAAGGLYTKAHDHDCLHELDASFVEYFQTRQLPEGEDEASVNRDCQKAAAHVLGIQLRHSDF